ncbi:hypothetical protein E2562_012596 [Oryza meyeriana var. granulata]|uniref:Uncharacterized protein n=1 Tax=Oryza meyeriana var. granulata TaxID=110450 RepID=A0A6G1CH01_9ORYZ|nr:hypothetical protein E2562_012596 [Oryza meyeriana var. granulata]
MSPSTHQSKICINVGFGLRTARGSMVSLPSPMPVTCPLPLTATTYLSRHHCHRPWTVRPNGAWTPRPAHIKGSAKPTF